MPYIKQEDRDKYDPILRELRNKIVENCKTTEEVPGALNYCITVLILSSINKKFGKIKYHLICMIDGVLTNVGREIYRRISVKYEDKKINENGDLKEF